MGRQRSLLSRGVVLGALAIGILSVGAAAGVEHLTNQNVRVDDPAESTPQPVQPGDVVEAPGSPAPFPTFMENEPGVRHRSGGPYISEEIAIDRVREHLCPESVKVLHLPGARDCAKYEFTARFFPRYEDAYIEHGPKGWGFVAGWARDREVYLVSVKGTIEAYDLFKAPGEAGTDPETIDHWNAEIDATTGEILGQGTAGEPLK